VTLPPAPDWQPNLRHRVHTFVITMGMVVLALLAAKQMVVCGHD
jgi:hypothetical protein